AERLRKCCEASLFARTGWFSDSNERKTTPAASVSEATRRFLDDAATPPCGDARRGLRTRLTFSQPRTMERPKTLRHYSSRVRTHHFRWVQGYAKNAYPWLSSPHRSAVRR